MAAVKQKTQESSLWELLGDSLGERGDTVVVSYLICSGTGRLLDLSSKCE